MDQAKKWMSAAALAAACGVTAADQFSIVVLPDTQNYVNNSSNAALFTQQTAWIADQIQNQGNPFNIVFVTHVGDVVSEGNSILQWDRADASMSQLEGGLPESIVPWSILPGNHDYDSTGNKSTGTANYVSYFGPSRFAGVSWFGGAEASGNNTYQLFQGGGQTYLHLALEWQPTANVTNGPVRDPSPIEWAQAMIDANPGLPVIVSTHEYVDDVPPGRSTAGEAMWNQLVKANDQIVLVLGGHFHSQSNNNDGEYHQISTNNYGKPVLEVLQDFQDYPSGGQGWLRIFTFDTATDSITVRTYSPVLDQFQTETVLDVGQYASFFTLPLDFDARFDFAEPPEPPVEVFEEQVIREGLNGYVGTQDKEVRSSGSDAANGNDASISVDGDDGSPGLQPNHGLVKFENIVGTGANQIAPSAVFRSALLRLNVTNPGSGMRAFRMTAPWDESTTWAGLGGNGVTIGTDSVATPDAVVGADNGSENVPAGTLDLDVTPSLRAWLGGADNQGVGLIPFTNGTNGIDFTTSESSNPPALVIRRIKAAFLGEGYVQGVDAYTGAVDTQIREADPTLAFGSSVDLGVDSADPSPFASQVLIRFNGIDTVEPGRQIVRAFLSVTGTNPGNGASVHRMIADWDDAATWGGSFGGNGVQADGIEAVALADTTIVGGTGRVEIDVTASVQAWAADPASNRGWALLPLGTDGWDIRSSEAASEGDRPELLIVFGACVADITLDGQVDSGDLSAFVAAFLAGEAIADITDDGQVDSGDLSAFVVAFLAGC